MGHNRNLADYAHHFDGTNIDLGSGNIETEGVVTYEDVTNVDSVGIITARAGVKVPDNQKVFLGTGDDLQIYHNSTDSVIVDNSRNLLVRADGTGDLYLQSDNKVILSDIGANEIFIECNDDADVKLFYNNSQKLATTTTGATVTGTLVSDGVTSELDLSAISSSISNTATDIFVYDTRKDSDGGAWRKRTQNTSWYNETLNTSTRGSRKVFPAVAVIVSTSSGVIIYDGDDPDLPMWMIFEDTLYDMINTHNLSPSSFSLSAKNGNLLVGSYNANYGEANVINFISDSGVSYYSSHSGDYNGNISQRNDGLAQTINSNYGTLVNNVVKDVAVTVLPNAPIDDATGLPVPTIAVATQGGVSIIKDDKTIVDSGFTGGINYLSFSENGDRLFVSRDDSRVFTSSNTSSISADGWGNDNEYFRKDASNTANFPWINEDSSGPSSSRKNVKNVYGSQYGITVIDETPGVRETGMGAWIASDYNTGWMQGDIKGAFLSDTDTTQKTNGQTDPDRSKNNYALSVTGTINKSAVATGADLVGYHGFSGSNYLRHTNGINYGNAATITMGGWSKISASSVDADYRYLCSVKSGAEVLGLAIHVDNNSGNSGKPYFYDVTNSSLQSDGPRVDDNQWHHIIGVLDGTSKKIYIDGELITSANVTGINLSSVNITNVGHYVPGNNNTPNYSHGGYLALIKFSGSAPSAEQVKKMYEDEKMLFQENAKCTLYGSSDGVTALGYDEDTELLHVGTSAGRSDFQGLRRINNTTTAVTTAISASDNLIAEQ